MKFIQKLRNEKITQRGKGKFSQGKGGTKTCNDSSIGSCVRASVTEAHVTVYVWVHMPRECVYERKDVHAYCSKMLAAVCFHSCSRKLMVSSTCQLHVAHAHTHKHTRTRTHTYTRARIRTRARTHTHTHTHTHTTHAHTHARTHAQPEPRVNFVSLSKASLKYHAGDWVREQKYEALG